jgi:hypothetical protein
VLIELTQQQQLELKATEGLPRAVVPGTKETYVLVPEHLFQRVKAVLSEDLDAQETGMLVEETMREYDAGDPLLETYQKYRV